MSTWQINGESPEFYGLVVAGGQFASGSVSTVRLERVADFDAAEVFPYGGYVAITRDAEVFFQGRCRAIPKSADGASEGQTYLVEDAWAELERLTYQEPWLIRQTDYTGTAYSPAVVLGMDSAGSRIGVGQQIEEVLAFAVDAGVTLAVGSIPAGMMLWPSEVTGMSCAEVIRTCLRYYPDWIPWLDHTAEPPLFHVTPRSGAEARTLAVTECEDFSVTKTQDRVPEGVRIIYQTAVMIDDEVYRSMSIDQYPPVSAAALVAPAGAGILCTTVELAGMQMQIEKQQVQTRAIPEDASTAKVYLKKKFPFIRDIPDGHFSVAGWTRTVVVEDDDEMDPVDTKLERQLATTLAQMPRELVRGNIAEWMQKRVGGVTLDFGITPTASATAEEARLLAKVTAPITIKGTNAITKIYKGVSSYTAGEAVPTGIAQAYYETLASGCYFEGSATLAEAEIGATQWHGCKLHLSGGVSEWAAMGAPIHTVDWDLQSRRVTLNFGPNPDYAVQDFVEYLRLLNKREHTEWTSSERSGDQHGAAAGISARGDSVGGFDGPETIYGGGTGGGLGQPFELVASGTPGDNILRVRESTIAGDTPAGFTAGFKPFTISDSAGVVYAKLTINDTTGTVTAVAVEKATTLPANTATLYHELLGSYMVTGAGGSAVISANNTRYGPVHATFCRNWYAAEAPFHAVSLA